jgi:glycosyltransferase involved in cell wall biosynthesis
LDYNINYISVILPVYNAEKYLRQAVDSVLNQTFANFEFLIYNDGSTDSSLDILNSYTDSRIKIRNLDSNIGLIKLLNLAFKEAKGKYIARMDADDICLPTRFEEQINFLEKNPQYGICGTQCQIIGTDKILAKPTKDIDLRWWIFKGSPLAHPSIMLRSSILKEYSLEFKEHAYVVEDFDLWWRMAFHTKMANLSKVLLNYRIHEQQESSAKQKIQAENFRLSQVEFMHELGLPEQYCDPFFMDNMLSRSINYSSQNLIKLWKIFKCLYHSKSAVLFFGKENIDKQWREQSVFALQNLESFKLPLLSLLLQSRFRDYLKISHTNVFSFFIKSLLNWKTR